MNCEASLRQPDACLVGFDTFTGLVEFKAAVTSSGGAHKLLVTCKGLGAVAAGERIATAIGRTSALCLSGGTCDRGAFALASSIDAAGLPGEYAIVDGAFAAAAIIASAFTRAVRLAGHGIGHVTVGRFAFV